MAGARSMPQRRVAGREVGAVGRAIGLSEASVDELARAHAIPAPVGSRY